MSATGTRRGGEAARGGGEDLAGCVCERVRRLVDGEMQGDQRLAALGSRSGRVSDGGAGVGCDGRRERSVERG